jgi:tight adherence protein B
MDEFHKELPQATELLAGAIQAGSSLRQALVQVAAFSSPVVAREFREILRLTQFGHSMDAAFDRWSSQTRSQPALDMSFCIRLSVQSGGSLSEALKRFAEALRQELLLAEKMKTLTSQGRLQALVMLAIPVLLGLTLLMIDPESARFFLQTWQGLLVIVFVLTLETLGALWIRRLVRVEI